MAITIAPSPIQHKGAFIDFRAAYVAGINRLLEGTDLEVDASTVGDVLTALNTICGDTAAFDAVLVAANDNP